MPKPTAAQRAKLPPALLAAVSKGKTGAMKPSAGKKGKTTKK